MSDFALFLAGICLPIFMWAAIRVAEWVEREQMRQATTERLRRDYPDATS